MKSFNRFSALLLSMVFTLHGCGDNGEACTPECEGKECGLDGCGGLCPPGCGEGGTCNNETGQCEVECTDECNQEGDRYCNVYNLYTCGYYDSDSCLEWESYRCPGICVVDQCSSTCQDECIEGAKRCSEKTLQICSQGTDGCTLWENLQFCQAGEICNEVTGQCEQCTPDCSGRECGIDGCGDLCSPGCGAGEWCINGACEVSGMGMDWILIPGGTYMMGSDTGDPDEQPVHQVTMASFEMTKTEVTMIQYQACVDDGACTDATWGTHCNLNVSGRDDHPVNCVDWYQAVDFCTWAGGRLPSEAEWEYAARSGGQDILYPWGNQAATCEYAVFRESGLPGDEGCGEIRTWEVCSKPLGDTRQGLCDMAGNVYEWLQDWYHDSYTGAPSEGSAWEDPVGTEKVLRGGGWRASDADGVRASNRAKDDPAWWGGDSRGIRCARDVQ